MERAVEVVENEKEIIEREDVKGKEKSPPWKRREGTKQLTQV